MQIIREGNKFTAIIDDLSGQLAKSEFENGNKFAPGSMHVDVNRFPGIVSPKLALQRDIGEPGDETIRAITKGSDGSYYGLYSSAGAIAIGTISLGSSSTSTNVDTDAGVSGADDLTPLVEWQDYLWFYESATKLAKFGTISSGTGTITLGNGSPNTPATLTGNVGKDILPLKSFLYWCNKNSVGRSSAHNSHNATALTLEDEVRVRSLAPWGDFVMVGANVQNEAGFSRLYRWDGISTLIEGKPIFIPDTGLRAIRNVGGIIMIFCITNSAGTTFENLLRVYGWAGGESVELIYEMDLKNTDTNSITLMPSMVDSYAGKAWFGMYARTADTMNLDNGVYSLTPQGVLNLDYISTADTNDTTDLAFQFVKWVDGRLFTIHVDSSGSNVRFSHIYAQAFSTPMVLNLPAIQPDPRFKSVIRRIRFPMKPLPASNTVQILEKTDQAASFSAVKTFSTTNTKLAKVEDTQEYAFQPGNHHQVQIKGTGSGATKPEIILPIIIEGEILEDVN